jgi:uncharacterized protein YkwD
MKLRRLAPLLLLPIAIGSAHAVAAPAHPVGVGATPPLVWRASTQSPEPYRGAKDKLYSLCGDADAALVQVAARNAGRQLRGEGHFASDELAFTLRAAGGPHVWPRAWSIEGKALEEADLEKRVGDWSKGMKALGQRRCGIVRMRRADGTQVVSAVTIDALADMDRVPTLARVGEWINLRGKMLVPATEAKVVLLGPRGQPRTVLASLSDDEVRATFAVDQPGPWLVQVLATVSTGPRPVLEAYVHAGSSPPLKFAESPAPGEDAPKGSVTDVEALRTMLNAARATEGLGALVSDETLDALAAEHSEKMMSSKTVGHDVGDGDPGSRLRAAGVVYRSSGENVASASSLPRAHRALWASPSHRRNVLENRFSKVGIGVSRSEDGRVWVTELFVD